MIIFKKYLESVIEKSISFENLSKEETETISLFYQHLKKTTKNKDFNENLFFQFEKKFSDCFTQIVQNCIYCNTEIETGETPFYGLCKNGHYIERCSFTLSVLKEKNIYSCRICSSRYNKIENKSHLFISSLYKTKNCIFCDNKLN